MPSNSEVVTHIQDAHKRILRDLQNGTQSFALFSCFVNEEPAVSLVHVTKEGGEYNIQPLFVSITAGMKITDHDGKLGDIE